MPLDCLMLGRFDALASARGKEVSSARVQLTTAEPLGPITHWEGSTLRMFVQAGYNKGWSVHGGHDVCRKLERKFAFWEREHCEEKA